MRLIPIGLAVAPTILLAWSASGARAATVQGEAGPARDSTAEAVVEVQSGGAAGLGFLVDPSGLIITSSLLVHDVDYAVVALDRGGRFLAQVLTPEVRSGIAVLRMNPEVLVGVRPLPFPDRNTRPPRRGPPLSPPAATVAREQRF